MNTMFIVFEGVEGAGKSSQLQLLLDKFAEHKQDVLAVKEPGGTPMGEAARNILLNPAYTIRPVSELFLLNASRHQLVYDKIRPALDKKQLVLCDRYVASSIAYQAYGRGLELEFVLRSCNEATGGLMPNLTILLDLAPDIGLQRVAARGHSDRLEQADITFHQRVRQGFLAQAQANPTWHIIDAHQSAEVIHRQIWDTIQPYLASGENLT